jgi:hypothetical protein
VSKETQHREQPFGKNFQFSAFAARDASLDLHRATIEAQLSKRDIKPDELALTAIRLQLALLDQEKLHPGSDVRYQSIARSPFGETLAHRHSD